MQNVWAQMSATRSLAAHPSTFCGLDRVRVLVTRPMPDAARTAARLRDLGHAVLAVPITAMKPLPIDLEPRDCDVIVLTSANAARAVMGSTLLRAKPTFTVGTRTAEVARSSGFVRVEAAAGNAHALLDLIASIRPQPRRILYLAGVGRKPFLEAGLRSAGFELDVREVYAMIATECLPEEARTALSSETIDAVVHYSRASATLFCELLEQVGESASLHRCAHHCISEDCAEPLRLHGARNIVLAAAPDEEALLSSLGLAQG